LYVSASSTRQEKGLPLIQKTSMATPRG
jgi:hypothetical protein